jgi:hypothetical protein
MECEHRQLYPQTVLSLDELKSWRPITISSTLKKLFLATVNRRLATLATMFPDISGSSQTAYKPGCERHEHTMYVYLTLRTAILTNSPANFALLDVSKAFDSIPVDAIFNSLMFEYGIRPDHPVLGVIRNIYRDATYQIKDAPAFRKPIAHLCGIQQGCPISPLLFTIAVAALERVLHTHHSSTTILNYADDINLYDPSLQNLQKSLQTASENAQNRSMDFNASKTCLISVNSGSHAKITVGTTPVEKSRKTVRYLGVNFNPNSDFTLVNNFVFVSPSYTSALSSKLLPMSLKKIILQTYVYPKLLNNCEIIALELSFSGSTGLPSPADWLVIRVIDNMVSDSTHFGPKTTPNALARLSRYLLLGIPPRSSSLPLPESAQCPSSSTPNAYPHQSSHPSTALPTTSRDSDASD